MRINHFYGTQTTPIAQPQAAKGAGKVGAAGAGSKHETDEGAFKVSISPEAKALASSSEGGLDAAKVERLKGQVESGSLHVDAKAIAARLVNGG
jgi:flagellar biosynthesis anti-sigma factor FlgM